MTLVVALTDCKDVWIAADTRGILKTGDLPPVASTEIFDKIMVRTSQGRSLIAANAGEAMIDQKKIFEYLTENEQHLFSEAGLISVRDILSQAWQHDVDCYPWDSGQDKMNFISAASVRILIVTSPSKFSLIEGTVGALTIRSYDPAPTIVAFGVTDLIRSMLGKAPTTVTERAPFLSTVFQTASADISVGFPVDLVRWQPPFQPFLQRYANPKKLAEIK